MKEKDKEKMKKIRLFLVLLVGAGIISACERDPFVEADPLYRVGKYEEAWQVYKKAAGEFKESPLLYYNLGVGLYKKGDYPQAVEYFTKALITENVELEARANYNIGNCRFRQGEQAEKDDLVKAIELYQEAQDYFQRAVELNPQDEDGSSNQKITQEKIGKLSRLSAQQGDRKLKREAAREKGTSLKPEPTHSPSVSRQKDFHQQGIQAKKRVDQQRDIKTKEGQEWDPKKAATPAMTKGEAEKFLAEYLLEEEGKTGVSDKKRRSMSQGVQKDW